MTDLDTPVLIVGGGPVGLTTSIDLARRGVRSILIDKRAKPGFIPKMERCNARTMEVFRRLGLADRIRAAGYGGDVSMDVFIVKNLAEPPLLRHAYPSANELKARIAETNDGTQTLEPYQLISQYTLEPLLKSVAEDLPEVDVRFGHELIDLTQNDQSVTATVRTADGAESTITAAYVVGADGGGSTTRSLIGSLLEGEPELGTQRQGLFRSEHLFERLQYGQGRHYHVADDRIMGIVVQDDCKHFSLHARVDSDEEMLAAFRQVVGFDVDIELLSSSEWTMRLMLASPYRVGRVFLAGDAAHLVIPTGGLGMNTGIGDAVDIAWKLHAVLAGWADEALLDTYEIERRQIGARNIRASGTAFQGRSTWRNAWAPEIWDDSPDGERIRKQLVSIADREQRKSNSLLGIEAGYRYLDSPVICNEEQGIGPDPENFVYIPTTWPGARVPHVWLPDGTALQDNLGLGYTLIALGDDDRIAEEFAAAFAAFDAPFDVLRIDGLESSARAALERDYILVRPDLHVVWRGDAQPDDATRIAATATGRLLAEVRA